MAASLTISYDTSNDPRFNIQGHLLALSDNASAAAVKSTTSENGNIASVTLTGRDDNIMSLLKGVRTDYDPEESPNKTTLTFVVNKSFGSVSDYLFNMFTDARSMVLKSSFNPVGEGMELKITGSIKELHSLLNPAPNSPETNSPNRNSRLPKIMKPNNGRSNRPGIAFNRRRVTVKQPLLGGRRRRKTRSRR